MLWQALLKHIILTSIEHTGSERALGYLLRWPFSRRRGYTTQILTVPLLVNSEAKLVVSVEEKNGITSKTKQKKKTTNTFSMKENKLDLLEEGVLF